MEENIEIWKSLEFLGYPNYQVSNFGRVKSLKRGKEKILKTYKDKYGYLILHLYNNSKVKTYFVHRLVALSFIPNPEKLPMINHKDESRDNNCVENLEWCDCKYNLNYGLRNIRLRKKLKGRHLSEEHKQKLRKPHKQKLRKPLTEEHKQNMSKAISKPILQFTLEGVFIREWQSATSASKELKINRGNITQCCKEKLKTCGGFIWRYKE